MRIAKLIRAGALCAIACAAVLAATRASALAAPSGAAWWGLDSTIASEQSPLPLKGEAQVTITATDLGDAPIEASREHPITITDVLPEGVKAVKVDEAGLIGEDLRGAALSCPAPFPLVAGHEVVSCELQHPVAPYQILTVRFTVMTEMSQVPATPVENVVRAQGLNVSTVTVPRTWTVSKTPGATPFGLQNYELIPENEDGTGDTQAGSHPFQLTARVDFNQTLAPYRSETETGVLPSVPALPRKLGFNLPPGLIGDVNGVAKCTEAQFASIIEKVIPGGTLEGNLCPAESAVGVATATVKFPPDFPHKNLLVPLFNLVPAAGEPARFGFEVENVPIVLKTSIPTGGDYGVKVSLANISEAAQVLSSQVTFWGDPSDPVHDSARGWECLELLAFAGEENTACGVSVGAQAPLLTLPTSCSERPETTAEGESWPTLNETGEGANGHEELLGGETSYTFPSALTGCSLLGFEPSMGIAPEQQSASTPTGLNVGVSMPQSGLTAASPAEPALKETTVKLPAGLGLNPAAANGLQACSTFQFGSPFSGADEKEQLQNKRFSEQTPGCPDAAKVGTVSIETPLLENEVTGSVYLAAQNVNPFESPLALYVIAEDPTAGVTVKLAGEVNVDDQTGQISTTFRNTPAITLFRKLEFHFFGGQRSPLSTPPLCGTYTAATSFTGWSGAVHEVSPSFAVTAGAGGGACASSPSPFVPSLQAKPTNSQGGALSPFTFTVGHRDGDQPLERISLRLPPGLGALIAQVTPCPEERALADACEASSLVGYATVAAGLGNEPVTLGGQVYLTGPLKATTTNGAAPFGFLAVTHAAAGPFDLGYVNVFSTLSVDEHTAVATVTTDPIPERLKGVPTQIKELEVTVERPGNQPFAFNPTNCNQLSVEGQLSGYEGASASLSYPFIASNCANLPFKPAFTALAAGQGSKASGTGFAVKVTSAGLGQANIAKTTVALPKQLPSRLTTIQKACLAAVFEANPASCDEGSVVGFATIHTPVFKNPLTGPAYLVSHGNAAWPDIEFLLQGEGLTIVLDGKTEIKKGITTATFEAVPDEPFTNFEAVFPSGPHSALTANVPEKDHFSLCGQSLVLPTTLTGQNGKTIKQSTKVAIEGCGAVKGAKVKKLTRAQKLAKALDACRHRHKHSTQRRQSCERRARSAYGPKKHVSKAERSARGLAR